MDKTNQAGWTQKEIDDLQEAEKEMDTTLSNPNSTYTEMAQSIDNFFDKW